mgnify:CR=1 FL=1
MQFNEAQIQAIQHNTGPCMVIAGPGSGKTTVLTHRVRYLIERYGVNPSDILVITFTKAAAEQMKLKFKGLSEGRNSAVTFGTFHAVFFTILKAAYNYSAHCIIKPQIQHEFVKDQMCRLELEYDDENEAVAGVLSEISCVKGEDVNIDEYESRCIPPQSFRIMYRAYDDMLVRKHLIDFDDMIVQCRELLMQREDYRRAWQNKYKYILIDEFQDINKAQFDVVRILADEYRNLFVVGDDDQSIYGFRGARPEIMIEFKDYYPEAELIVLDVNYRSTQSIINVAGRVIENNKTRLDKCAHANNDKDFQPDIRKFRNQVEELKFVVSKIKEYENQGISLSEMAILVRNNSQIQEISSFLKNRKIEAESGKHRSNIYNGMVAKDILSYVRGALKFDGTYFNEDLIYVLNKPQRYISRQVVLNVNMNISAVRRIYSKNNIDSFLFHIEMIRKLPPQAALSYIRKGAGYEEYLRLYAIENNIPMSGLLKQLEQLVQECSKFNTLEQWINSIDSAQNSEGQNFGKKSSGEGGTNNRINIMTMHGSKGLEFKAVFIVDANQGIIPTSKALRERDFEEERRLFYVAITRAIDYLNVYAVEERLGCPIEVSMFVEEML